jgi:hypothetical protein
MGIDRNGFLDAEMISWIAKHHKDNEALFDLCTRLNQYAQQLLFRLNVHSNNLQEILVSSLFVRALSTYQASLLTCERGMVAETRVLLRTLLEILFRLLAIARSHEIAQAFVLEDERHRRKFIGKYQKLGAEVKEAQCSSSLTELLSAINQKISEQDIKELKTEWFAHKAGLDDFYNSAYAIFSGSVHANVRDLEEILVTDDQGNVRSLNYGPDVSGLAPLLVTAAESLIFIVIDVGTLFSINTKTDCTLFHKQLNNS